jgi:regulator of replication initiation timing
VALHAEIDALKQRIDELTKINEELKAHHENDRQVINQLRFRCADNENKAQILEAQMDVVRLIFGGKNNG